MPVGNKVISFAERYRQRLTQAALRAGLGAASTPAFLAGNDPRWATRAVVELATQSFDADMLGVGSSPWRGDVASLGLVVPTVATPDQTRRYLFRLLAAEIPNGKAMIIRGIRQLATIRAFGRAAVDCVAVPFELEVTSPGWHFFDGNISWHLRWEPNLYSPESVFDPAGPPPALSPSMSGTDSALLYIPPSLPYFPPGAGIPPGADVEFLGTWRDMRFPWTSTDWTLAIPLVGPGILRYYASVHQTNAATRCPLGPIGATVGRPEDRFVAAFQADGQVIYGRVAGALSLELFPWCQEFAP